MFWKQEADKNQALDKCAGSGFCGTKKTGEARTAHSLMFWKQEADKNQALDKCAGSGFCGTINRRAYGKTEVIVCV